MIYRIRNGTLIVSERAALPASCEMRTESFCAGWRTITNFEARGLDKRFREAGWSCFQKGATSTVSVLGFGIIPTIQKALKKMVQHSGALKFNCLEITQAIQKSFVGISYVRMSAKTRDIRQRPQ